MAPGRIGNVKIGNVKVGLEMSRLEILRLGIGLLSYFPCIQDNSVPYLYQAFTRVHNT